MNGLRRLAYWMALSNGKPLEWNEMRQSQTGHSSTDFCLTDRKLGGTTIWHELPYQSKTSSCSTNRNNKKNKPRQPCAINSTHSLIYPKHALSLLYTVTAKHYITHIRKCGTPHWQVSCQNDILSSKRNQIKFLQSMYLICAYTKMHRWLAKNWGNRYVCFITK